MNPFGNNHLYKVKESAFGIVFTNLLPSKNKDYKKDLFQYFAPFIWTQGNRNLEILNTVLFASMNLTPTLISRICFSSSFSSTFRLNSSDMAIFSLLQTFSKSLSSDSEIFQIRKNKVNSQRQRPFPTCISSRSKFTW